MSIWTWIRSAIDDEYDRRVKAASNVREYTVGGHGHADHDHDEAIEHPELRENQEGDSHAAFGTPTADAPAERATVAIGH